MKSTSFIEISKEALKSNIDFIREVIGDNCKYSSVIKGNAYGHGISHFVPVAMDCGVRHFSVFNSSEAEEVYKITNGDARIMVMGFLDNQDMEWAVEKGIEFFVFNPGRLRSAIDASKKTGKRARIHLELETGLNRTGFSRSELKDVISLLEANPEHYVIEGVCTHFAGAENIANYLRIRNQYKAFSRYCKWIEGHGLSPVLRHTACSAATMTYPKTHMDMVRIGIMQYGYWPSRETMIHYLSKRNLKTDPLQRIITWKSRIMETKTVKTGEFIGYGTSYMAENEMLIAIIPVGYSEGYSRSLSNHGRILLNGKRVSVIGMVNMNMLIIDITHVAETEIGDEVVLIGAQGDIEVSVSSFSELSNQLNYELLTRLPRNIPRIIVD